MNKNIFDRVDLRQIASFILFREETISQSESYEQQLKKAMELACDAIKKSIAGEITEKEATLDISDACDIYKEIYTEIGMKLGARMIMQLLHVDDSVNNLHPIIKNRYS